MIQLFAAHCDTILRCYLHGAPLRRNTGHLDLERTKKYGYAQFFAIFGSPEDTPGCSLWETFLTEYALFRSELDANDDRIAFCRTGPQAQGALAAG